MQLNTQPDYMELEIHLSLCSMMENVGCVQGKHKDGKIDDEQNDPNSS